MCCVDLRSIVLVKLQPVVVECSTMLTAKCPLLAGVPLDVKHASAHLASFDFIGLNLKTTDDNRVPVVSLAPALTLQLRRYALDL